MSEKITPEEVTRREAEVVAVLAKDSADAAVALAPLPVILQVPGVPEAKSRAPRFPKLGAGHTLTKHGAANAAAMAAMVEDLGPSEPEMSVTREEIVASRTGYVASHTPAAASTDLFGRFERAATEAQRVYDADTAASYRAQIEPFEKAGREATARFEKVRDAHGSRLLKLASYNWPEIVRTWPRATTRLIPGTKGCAAPSRICATTRSGSSRSSTHSPPCSRTSPALRRGLPLTWRRSSPRAFPRCPSPSGSRCCPRRLGKASVTARPIGTL